MKLRYSDIIGHVFYNIGGFSPEDQDMIDVHFTAAGHHLLMLHRCDADTTRQFHVVRHRAHLRAMMEIIYQKGDFSSAKDESLRGLDEREGWDPDNNFSLPDPDMFNSIGVDPTLLSGQPHPSDWYLNSSALEVLIDPIYADHRTFNVAKLTAKSLRRLS